MALVLGIDPGFASVGFAIVRLRPDLEEIVAMGVIRTSKWKAKRTKKGETKEKKPSASEDNLRRAQEIAAALGEHLKDIAAICVESMSFPRNASNAAKMAMCWGAIATLAHLRNLPVVQISPQALKKALTGRIDAEKNDVQVALLLRYSIDTIMAKVEGIPKTMLEHPYDALGAVVACLSREEIQRLPKG